MSTPDCTCTPLIPELCPVCEAVQERNFTHSKDEIDALKTQNADLLAALEDVMEWIRNWEPDFTDDVEWRETETKARAAIEGAKP